MSGHMQSNDLETNWEGEGPGCAPRGLVSPAGSFWLGEGCRIVPLPRNGSSTSLRPSHSGLQFLPKANAGTCGTFCPLRGGIAIENMRRCGSEPLYKHPSKDRTQPQSEGVHSLSVCLSVHRAGGSRGSIQPPALRFSPSLATKTNKPPSKPKCNSKHKRNCKFNPL